MQLPIISTKVPGVTEKFNLNTVLGRQKYFEAKIGKEIQELKEYLDSKSFVMFMLAKKSAGKGTYSKMFQELMGVERVLQISIGDLVRKTHQMIESNDDKLTKLYEFINTNYRGFVSSEEALKSILERSTDKISIPSELILCLIKQEISKTPNKAFIIDGFPRAADQITYSLFFREIMNLRDDPDFFVVIDVPDAIIDERIKYRRICPICNTPRNYKLLPTEKVVYNEATKDFDLICDNSNCEGFGKQTLVKKEGDELGIEPLRNRLKDDGDLIEQALNLHGISNVKVRNHVPIEKKNLYEDYELTPEFHYSLNPQTQDVVIEETPWVIKDNDGVDCHSLLSPPAVVIMIRQIHSLLLSS